ncbi:N-acetylglucosamine kinase [Luteimonas cucumeris]|uniref:N-acetylglucosamine kinase n=1 Tax=Luteimonas cucumeris TaxID=985012 RepID=A0A562L2F2_9GAMM|nr:ROK family protein [Luteimonas cucumeris]TWI01849.1 N-acetylglucosamine kinase [Luteimonas cucumeris]
MTRAQVWYGLDIGGTKIELVACDEALEVCHRRRVDTPGQDYEAFLQAITQLVEDADHALGVRAAVGLGLPGVTDPVSGCQLSSNVPALNGQQVVPALQARLDRPLYRGNDLQCFALSEANGGAAQGHASMLGVILGTGAGGGFCVEGRLVAGYNGMAGEWGHWTLPATLLERHALPMLGCPCGLRGCLERYVSGRGLSMLHRHLGGDDADASVLVHRAHAGDALAQRALDIHLDLLGHSLAQLVLILDPHAIVLGGGLSKLESLYDTLPAAMAPYLFKGVRVPPILPPVFGDAGGARGAALLARQRSLGGHQASG